MYISKRHLGEGYLVATGVVLAAVLLARVGWADGVQPLWGVVFSVPAIALVGATYWVQQLDLTSDQVWTTAKWSALGLGIGTAVVVGVEILTPASSVAGAEAMLLGTTLATTAVLGASVGVIAALRSENEVIERQNTVLHRVLRHNLRNDMTVVLCLLDQLEAEADGGETETIEQARAKIQSLVGLADKVRQANVHQADRSRPRQSRDVASLVETRLDELEDTYPNLDVERDLPDTAVADVGDSFGLVVDNVVESALSPDATEWDLAIRVRSDGSTVRLEIDDYSKTIPDADVSAVSDGGETALEHGRGVELWLVDWLVAANDGDLRFEVGEDLCRIVVEVQRARSSWLR